jgi:hypothetical protein
MDAARMASPAAARRPLRYRVRVAQRVPPSRPSRSLPRLPARRPTSSRHGHEPAAAAGKAHPRYFRAAPGLDVNFAHIVHRRLSASRVHSVVSRAIDHAGLPCIRGVLSGGLDRSRGALGALLALRGRAVLHACATRHCNRNLSPCHTVRRPDLGRPPLSRSENSTLAVASGELVTSSDKAAVVTALVVITPRSR